MLAAAAIALPLSSCATPDLSAVPQAAAGCEAPTADELNPTPLMLPGRVCQDCHRPGGQAGLFVWNASGTVYGDPNSACNSGGLDGVQVDILDDTDQVLISLMTNQAGNFYTSEDGPFGLVRARLSKNGVVREMQGLQSSTACASCHYPGGPPPGRLFLAP